MIEPGTGFSDLLAGLAPKPEPKREPAPKPKAPAKQRRGLGDIVLIAEAQKTFNPGMPSPQLKGPSAQMVGQGTAQAAGTTGAWGKPS